MRCPLSHPPCLAGFPGTTRPAEVAEVLVGKCKSGSCKAEFSRAPLGQAESWAFLGTSVSSRGSLGSLGVDSEEGFKKRTLFVGCRKRCHRRWPRTHGAAYEWVIAGWTAVGLQYLETGQPSGGNGEVRPRKGSLVFFLSFLGQSLSV